MKKSKILTILILSIAAVISCKKNNADNVKPSLNFSETEKSVLLSSNSFGLTLFQNLASSVSADSNVFISPLSVSLALTMTYNGAATQTATAMQTTLGYKNMDKTEINQSCQGLMQTLQNCDPNVIMNIANSIWYTNKSFNVEDSFININKTYFNAEVTSADFSNPATVNLINNWVSTKTYGTINQIISSIPPDIVMFLLNAVYFKGTWATAFDSSQTAPGNFYLSDGSTTSANFMVQRSKLSYYSNSLFSSVELTYGNGNFSMVILLPNGSHNCTSILHELNQSNWNAWNADMQSNTDVQVYLPKFTLSYGNMLNNVLTLMGMGIAFSDTADFSGIDGKHDLSISLVYHKTYLQVNEKGTTASAVTAVGIVATVANPNLSPQPIIFDVNRPFIFAIKETTTNSIIFMGLIQEPTTN